MGKEDRESEPKMPEREFEAVYKEIFRFGRRYRIRTGSISVRILIVLHIRRESIFMMEVNVPV